MTKPPICAHCRFYQAHKAGIFGLCRRYPPTIIGNPHERIPAFESVAFPTLRDDQTCGEFKPAKGKA